MTVRQLVGAAALVQAMRRDGYGPAAREAVGGGDPLRLRENGSGYTAATGNPDPATAERVLYAAAE